MNKATKMLMLNHGRSDDAYKDAGSDPSKNGYSNGGYSKWNGKERREDNHHEPMAYSDSVDKESLTREVADRWMKSLVNDDGSTGPHWTMEQSKQVQAQRGLDCDTLEFWVAMNVVYSDYCTVAKDMSVNNMDFYAKMAVAFLNDADSVDNKLSAYYDYVVEH